jgi:threonyl-tRNA synthetase
MNDNSANDTLYRMRHSCAHVFAAAVQSLWTDAHFGVGPPTANGFYYDIDLDTELKQADLSLIEERMRDIVKKNIPFERLELPIDQAIKFMEDHHQPYKVELLNLLKHSGSTAVAKETGDESAVGESDSQGVDSVSFYKVGAFTDLCRGPHVSNSSEIGVFKLKTIAGAYWRGDSKNPQLQRIYGLCFKDKADLEHCEWQLEQAALRDHRKLGKELELFAISADVGAGLPLWLPRGMAIRDELERLAIKEERNRGYRRVATPHITKEGLYYQSGHLPYYAQDMYAPIDIEGENFRLRPMNCPHHHQIYLNGLHSYRDLPLRLSEYGQVYRYEASGTLSGLMRVRGFCQNDAHIYCRHDQAKSEFIEVMRLHAYYYEMFGIKDYWMRLSLPDIRKIDKYVDDPDAWMVAMGILREAMIESGYPYVEVEGEAAFYGPKVDFMIKSVVGTEYAISTNQLDFLAAQRFGLRYIAEDGSEQPVYVIHRAPLGAHERFVAFLIEHYAGLFPTWLSPVQVRIIPISDRHLDYANEVYRQIFTADIETGTGGIRVEIDSSAERMQKKIRNAQNDKASYMLVIGDKEMEAGRGTPSVPGNRTVSVRLRNGTDLGAMSTAAFLERLKIEITTRQDLIA